MFVIYCITVFIKWKVNTYHDRNKSKETLINFFRWFLSNRFRCAKRKQKKQPWKINSTAVSSCKKSFKCFSVYPSSMVTPRMIFSPSLSRISVAFRPAGTVFPPSSNRYLWINKPCSRISRSIFSFVKIRRCLSISSGAMAFGASRTTSPKKSSPCSARPKVSNSFDGLYWI